MGQPATTCRTCTYFSRGRGEHLIWTRFHGRCHLDVDNDLPTHANSRACEKFIPGIEFYKRMSSHGRNG